MNGGDGYPTGGGQPFCWITTHRAYVPLSYYYIIHAYAVCTHLSYLSGKDFLWRDGDNDDDGRSENLFLVHTSSSRVFAAETFTHIHKRAQYFFIYTHVYI